MTDATAPRTVPGVEEIGRLLAEYNNAISNIVETTEPEQRLNCLFALRETYGAIVAALFNLALDNDRLRARTETAERERDSGAGNARRGINPDTGEQITWAQALEQRDAVFLMIKRRAEAAEDRVTVLEAAARPIADYAEEKGEWLDHSEGEFGEFYRGAFRVSISYRELRAVRDAFRAQSHPGAPKVSPDEAGHTQAVPRSTDQPKGGDPHSEVGRHTDTAPLPADNIAPPGLATADPGAIRREALEAAARVAEAMSGYMQPRDAAKAIRALMEAGHG